MNFRPTTAARVLVQSPETALGLAWTAPNGENPLPHRIIHAPKGHRHKKGLPAIYSPSVYHANGQAQDAFDFTWHMRRLCVDIVSRCGSFHHIDPARLLFGVSQARSGRQHGLQAKVTPMRFANGERTRRRRGRLYQVQRYLVDGVEMLYLVTFCLPRFQNQTFDDKLITIFHELYHIAPEFHGDLRRHHGRYSVHTRSQKGYDREMAALAREYLSGGADPALHAFLRLSFNELHARYGRITGQLVPVPKLVPV